MDGAMALLRSAGGATRTLGVKCWPEAMNAELAALSAEFGQKLLAEVNDAAVVVDGVRQLDGLSPARFTHWLDCLPPSWFLGDGLVSPGSSPAAQRQPCTRVSDLLDLHCTGCLEHSRT